MRHSKAVCLLIFIFPQSCHLTEPDIEEHTWKYAEGFSIGDWIDFNNSTFSLSGDTIFLNGQPGATIISSKISVFGIKRSITIEAFYKKIEGVYVEK